MYLNGAQKSREDLKGQEICPRARGKHLIKWTTTFEFNEYGIKNSCGHKKDEYQMILVSEDDGHHCPYRRRCPEYIAAGTVIC